MTQQKQDTSVPINQFVIYDVTISAAQQTLVNPSIEPKIALDNAKEIFGGCFAGKQLTLVKYGKDGQVDVDYPNDILSAHNGVYLLRINNVKHKSLIKPADTTTNGVQDYNEILEETNPYCYVAIDNRDGICQMAIQKNSAAWGDTNAVRWLLTSNINKLFVREEIPLEISIDAKMRPSEIWEFCNGQCEQNGDIIQSISFVFPNQEKIAKENRIQNPKGYIKELARLMKLTDALKTSISVNYASADPKKIEKNARDLSYIVRACKNTSYNLQIKFRDYGVYSCDDLVRAIFPMDESLIHAFRDDWGELNLAANIDNPTYGLFDWCNYVNEQSKLYTDVERIPTKRRRKYTK